MLVTFFHQKEKGVNNGIAGIDYLLNPERVKSKTAKILKGDENLTRAIIKSLDYKTKAQIGCLSFQEPNIPQEAKEKIMQDFERTLLTDEMKGRYNILWVEHTDKGRLELNFVIPTIDLESKKAFTPFFHKADVKRIDLWSEIINQEYNLTSPKDPAKKRNIDYNKGQERSEARKTFKNHKELDNYFQALVSKGAVKNRDELIKHIENDLNDLMEITRQGDNYFSIKLKGEAKATRYKGDIYGKDFYRENQAETPELRNNRNRIDRKQNEVNREKLNEHIEYKARQYRERHEKEARKNREQHREHKRQDINITPQYPHINKEQHINTAIKDNDSNVNRIDTLHNSNLLHLNTNNERLDNGNNINTQDFNAIARREREIKQREQETTQRERIINTNYNNTQRREREINEREQEINQHNTRERERQERLRELIKRTNEHYKETQQRKQAILRDIQERLRERKRKARQYSPTRINTSYNKFLQRNERIQRRNQERTRERLRITRERQERIRESRSRFTTTLKSIYGIIQHCINTGNGIDKFAEQIRNCRERIRIKKQRIQKATIKQKEAQNKQTYQIRR